LNASKVEVKTAVLFRTVPFMNAHAYRKRISFFECFPHFRPEPVLVKRSFFSIESAQKIDVFPYVCPKPVLVKRSFFSIESAQKIDAFSAHRGVQCIRRIDWRPQQVVDSAAVSGHNRILDPSGEKTTPTPNHSPTFWFGSLSRACLGNRSAFQIKIATATTTTAVIFLPVPCRNASLF
jgi:hypothetical protein